MGQSISHRSVSFRQACVTWAIGYFFLLVDQSRKQIASMILEQDKSGALSSGDRNDIGATPSLMNSGVFPATTFQLLASLV